MPNAATVQDHAEARSKFINNLRKMKCPLRKVHTHEVVLELRAYTHITEPDRQHYDCIIYSNRARGRATAAPANALDQRGRTG